MDSKFVAQLKTKGMKWLVCSVNETKDIKRIVTLDPNGVITDYPITLVAD